MKNTCKIIIALLIFSYSFNLFAQDNISIYVSPHPDDWQLFMNPNAYQSVKITNEKVIFIHTTAGDAGNGTGNNNYVLAREEGSLRALRFMSNTFTSGSGLGTNMNETIVIINGHEILKYTYRNIVAYFLRLPDGNPNGTGYPLHSFKSLQKLYDGTISDISAVDNSTTYNSLSDLKNTLQSILDLESVTATNVEFNLGDDDDVINPNDHSDHVYSSKIMQDIANTTGNITINLYVNYHSSSKEQNVFNDDYLVSAGTWGVTTSGLSDNFHYSSWDSQHNRWIGKQYFRTHVTPISTINIALNKPTTASNHEGNRFSSYAVDDDFSLNSWWGANPYPQWWQVDLQDAYDVSKIIVTNYYDGTRYYNYDIEGSLDAVNWTTIADFNDNITPATNQGNTFNIANTSARYVRVNMNFNSANVGVHIVEFEAYGELSATNNTTNIALNKPTTASNHEGNRFSSYAVDDDFSLNSWWGANPYPQWWQVDLQDVYDVSKIIVTNYYDGTRYYNYDIEGSLDEVNWTTIEDFNDNTTPATNQGNTFNIANTSARFLRVNMNFNSANVGVHIVEFEAYGELRSTAKTTTLNQVENIEKPSGLLIYPNPINKGDIMVIELDYPINSTVLLEVHDFNGRSLISKTIRQNNTTNNISLNTSAFTTGLNIINLTIRGKTISKKVYIK